MSALSTIEELERSLSLNSTDYRELLIQFVKGEDIPTDRIKEILNGAGKSFDQFRQDLQLVQERKEAADSVASHTDRLKEADKLSARFNEYELQFTAMDERHRQEKSELVDQFGGAAEIERLRHEPGAIRTNAIGERARALQLLQRTADPAIEAEVREIGQAQSGFREERQERLRKATDRLEEVRAELNSLTARFPASITEGPVAAMKAAGATRALAELEQLEARLQEAQREVDLRQEELGSFDEHRERIQRKLESKLVWTAFVV